MGLYDWFMGYDFTERLLYGLAALFTAWFMVALWLRQKKDHWSRDWSESGFTAVWLALAIRALLAEPYSIPSESMVPTLLVRDHLLVSKTTFGWHIPFTQGRVLRFRDVRRGEIVIFVPPHVPKQSYVKRCVGLPGDTVEVRAKQVYINGQIAEVPQSIAQLSGHKLDPTGLAQLKEELQRFSGERLPVIMALQSKGQQSKLDLELGRKYWLGPIQAQAGVYYVEASMAHQQAYTRLLDQARTGELVLLDRAAAMAPSQPGDLQPAWIGDHRLGNRDWMKPYKLGPDEYWMMGDNRDNSLDSRYFGPIKAGALRGTPLVRYWPLKRAGIPR